MRAHLRYVLLALLFAAPSVLAQDAAPVPAQDAAPAAPAQDAAASKFSVWLPGRAWALEFTAPDFTLRVNEIQPDGRRYFLAEGGKSRVIFSVYLEAGKTAADASECKRSLDARAQSNSPFVHKRAEYGQIAGLETMAYTIAEVDGRPVNQRNVFACLVKEDVFVDLHLSKMFYKASDQPLFDAILQSVTFAAKEPVTAPVPVGNSMELWGEGGRFFLAHQYREAIAPYQKALDIEKIAPTLDKNFWRVLVDNLGVAYGITGDLERAKEVLDYGVSQDSTYPMFYYNLACVSAKKGDANDTKVFLKLAFDYRNNVIPGERLPDPRVDDSFQRLLLLDKEFRQWVNELFGSAK